MIYRGPRFLAVVMISLVSDQLPWKSFFLIFDEKIFQSDAQAIVQIISETPNRPPNMYGSCIF